MIMKLLLMIQYIMWRRGTPIPFNEVVHRLCPESISTGSACIQYLQKQRILLAAKGHMVPPQLGKLSIPQDPDIRGSVRDYSQPRIDALKPLYWGEDYPNLDM